MRTWRRWVPGVLSLLAAGPLWAQAPPPPAAEARLSLQECLAMALEHNLDLVLSRVGPQIAAESVQVSEAEFDPAWTSSSSRTETVQEPTNISRPRRFQDTSFSTGFRQRLNFGAQWTVTLGTQRSDVRPPEPNIFGFPPTEVDAQLQLQFTLPLLQGFGVEPTQERLLLARGNLLVSREELHRQAQSVIEAVEAAYWDVVAAREALRVAQQALRRAQELLELNRRKVEVGTLAPIEITQAEAGVASQEESVIVAETNLDNAEDELRRLLAIPAGAALWKQRIVPIDEPTVEPRPVDLEAAIERALARRPEVRSARQTLRNRELSERVARNRRRHQLDLSLSFSPNGTDIDELERTDPGPDGIFGTGDDLVGKLGDASIPDALDELPDIENRRWTAALNYTIPLGNRAARAQYRMASLERQRAELELHNLEQSIVVEVRRAARAVESGFKRVEAARANVVLQRKKLEAEQKKFENGMSTSFEVLSFQADLANAELAEIRARIDYNKALAALERAQGSLLEARGLRLAELERR